MATETETVETNIVASEFDVLTMNAIVTIHNPATGQHRTFRVKTQKDDASFAPGERIVSMLVGPDNNADYQFFGFVRDGSIQVRGKLANSNRELFELYGRMLLNPAKFIAKGAEYMVEKRCIRCGRRLTTPASVKSGIGPECAKK